MRLGIEPKRSFPESDSFMKSPRSYALVIEGGNNLQWVTVSTGQRLVVTPDQEVAIIFPGAGKLYCRWNQNFKSYTVFTGRRNRGFTQTHRAVSEIHTPRNPARISYWQKDHKKQYPADLYTLPDADKSVRHPLIEDLLPPFWYNES